MPSNAPALVWFRQDLRITDNPAFHAAASSGQPVLPFFVLDTASARQPGAASRWWLHHSLAALSDSLKERYGLDLLLRRGDPAVLVPALAEEVGAASVYWNRCYEPAAIRRDSAIKTTLKAMGLQVESFNSALLLEPWMIKTKGGGWFKQFTLFWRACLAAAMPAAPQPAPGRRIAPWSGKVGGDKLALWRLTPENPDWSGGLHQSWMPGEAGAKQRLSKFLKHALAGYATERDRPDLAATSRLSPHLHFGEIGPRQIWHAVQLRLGDNPRLQPDAERFLAELGWREFSYHLLYHFPDLPERNLRPEFDAFPWRDDAGLLRAWQRGRTGYPIVDAGMRELWRTGWMHNRVRMIAASFLVKHLRQDWRRGEAWFWDTLVDADLANNAASWQWVAGCGADAAPYFRIFNPVLQGERFDPAGGYVRQWVPELAGLPNKFLHKPWLAPNNIRAGIDYPEPVVSLGEARQAALDAFAEMRRA